MRSAIWYEFLLTFAIFIGIILYLYNLFYTGLSNVIVQISSIYSMQKLFIASYFLLYGYNLSYITQSIAYNTIFVPYISYNYYPKAIYLSNLNYVCTNALCFYYYPSNSTVSIVQNTYNQNIGSSFYISLYSKSPMLFSVYKSGNVLYNCNSQYNVTYQYFIYRNFITCYVSMYGNSSISFYPAVDIAILDSLKTPLNVYSGNLSLNKQTYEVRKNIYSLPIFYYYNQSILYLILSTQQ